MLRVALLAALVSAVVPATASAATGPSIIYGIEDGQPALHAWAYDGDTVSGWSSCAPDGSPCRPLPITRDPDGGDRYAKATPGVSAPGTVFEAVIARDGGDVTLRTPVWEGTLAPEPPTLTGNPVVGWTVQAQPGARHGGWASENAVAVGVIACQEPEGITCELVAAETSNPQPVRVEERWHHRYLFATQRWGSGNNDVIYVPEDPGPRMFADPVTSRSAASDRVTMAVAVRSPPLSPAPPVPTASVRERALRTKGKISVGRVTCAQPCKVAVKVSGGGRKAYTTTFVAKPGVTAITAPARRGKLTVRIHVDGKLLASGKLKA